MNQAMYASDKTDWGIWALFIRDDRMIKAVCTYNIQRRKWKSSSKSGRIPVGN